MNYKNIGFEWDNTITCKSCGMKKHIAINEGIDHCIERMDLVIFEQARAKCCNNPDYWMYPPKYTAKEEMERSP